MCHRRGDWSRTSSRASEPDEEREEESAWVGARAKDLLVTYVSGGEERSEEAPDRPTVEADSETTSADPTGSEVGGEAEEPEREEDPIPADD